MIEAVTGIHPALSDTLWSAGQVVIMGRATWEDMSVIHPPGVGAGFDLRNAVPRSALLQSVSAAWADSLRIRSAELRSCAV